MDLSKEDPAKKIEGFLLIHNIAKGKNVGTLIRFYNKNEMEYNFELEVHVHLIFPKYL